VNPYRREAVVVFLFDLEAMLQEFLGLTHIPSPLFSNHLAAIGCYINQTSFQFFLLFFAGPGKKTILLK
jgi:hypothetical protein